MHCIALIENEIGLLKMEGRFTFDASSEFKINIKRFLENPNLKEIHLDFTEVRYVDSNALGMLLLLREKAQPKGLVIKLLSPSQAVSTILDVVQFGKLFQIVPAPQGN